MFEQFYVLPVAKRGHLEVVKIFNAKGAIGQMRGMAALSAAACKGHLQLVHWFCAQPNSAFFNFNWIMAEAAAAGHLEVVRFSVEKGADNFDWAINNANKNGWHEVAYFLRSIK